ncbi:uncharacterized protein K452DRAFT_283312 [Aplosporella prunicola CBS 121167]|uniref:CSC1/OSCA1-like 7TM region domain-containing protein n=1 Tax=Aplosporella prunicola CBS 121167 TaxID=1176127 RepID=A0A6A6BRE8_9PEZI|nr:uncharacterized protein K452DRAFT_283312 [Aplosporella prunicola CBS 121167]KAF2146033.1 hypothetical protein K452DRAFT_283312 [Aplosporella prunicola CBS 121167]
MPGDTSAVISTYVSTIFSAFLAAAFSLLILALMLYPTAVLRWLQRKRYQYEVTFSLYMLTPTEKFIFNSFLFLFLSMIVIAASLYLPEHISMIVNRASYYLAGEPSSGLSSIAKRDFVDSSVAAVKTTADHIAGNGAGMMPA